MRYFRRGTVKLRGGEHHAGRADPNGHAPAHANTHEDRDAYGNADHALRCDTHAHAALEPDGYPLPHTHYGRAHGVRAHADQR